MIKITNKNLNSAYESWTLGSSIEQLAIILDVPQDIAEKIAMSWYTEEGFEDEGLDLDLEII